VNFVRADVVCLQETKMAEVSSVPLIFWARF
jgi:exonuclease III